jgi:hypothetical protein
MTLYVEPLRSFRFPEIRSLYHFPLSYFYPYPTFSPFEAANYFLGRILMLLSISIPLTWREISALKLIHSLVQIEFQLRKLKSKQLFDNQGKIKIFWFYFV